MVEDAENAKREARALGLSTDHADGRISALMRALAILEETD